MSNYNKYYSNYGGLSTEEYVNKYLRNSDIDRERITQLLQLFPKHTETVLDIGAGHGLFLEKLMLDKGIKGVGIEISDDKIQYGKSIGVDIRLGDAAELKFEDNSFDVVVCFEVLEHLPYGVYEKAIQEIQRVAKSYIIVGVPNNEKRIFIECPYCNSCTNPSLHLRSFDDNSISNLFADFSLMNLLHLGEYMKSCLTLIPINRKYSWSKFMVCPACGYSNDIKTNQSCSDEKPKSNLIRNIIFKVFPKYIVKRWLVAVYQK